MSDLILARSDGGSGKPAGYAASVVGHGLACAALVSVLAWGCGGGAREPGTANWDEYLRALDQALGRGDVRTALVARRAAYMAAYERRHWEGLAAVGDASARLADISDLRSSMLPEARRAYLAALLRARQAGSAAGVLRAAHGFARLGDRDAARQGLEVARALVDGSRDADVLAEIEALGERLDQVHAVTAANPDDVSWGSREAMAPR